MARCFVNSMRFQERVFGYEPWEPVTLLLTDLSDSGNAGAGPVPRNSLTVDIAPLSFAYETMFGNERMNTMMNHELVHLAIQDRPAAPERAMRRIFRGKVMPLDDHPETILYFYLTAPRTAAPRWYQEGVAVFADTWMAAGLGRAQGAWDEMVFRSMVRDGSHFYDPLGLVAEGTKVDFQVGVNAYLYGTRFITYLVHRHGPEALVRWVARHDGSRRYYAAQFKEVFGRSIDQAWSEWIEWEHDFQRLNLEAIREFEPTSAEDLSPRALGSVSRAFFEPATGKLYAAFNYPGVVAHLGAISSADGSVEKLIDIKDPVVYTVTSIAFDPGSRTLFFTTDNHEYRDIRALDLESGDSRTLLAEARIGDLAFDPSDGALWGLRHFNGRVTLVRIPPPYDGWKQVHSWSWGEVAYDLDVSPDGRLLSLSFGDPGGDQTLRLFETAALLAGDAEPRATVDFAAAIPNNFVFSPDGRYLYGSSYLTGVSNIFRYEIDGDELEAVSNTETGFFRPVPLGDDQLIVFRYTGDGFVASRIEARPLEDVNPIRFFGRQVLEEHPGLREWQVGRPAEIDLDEMITDRGVYRPGQGIALETVYPVVEGYKDSAAAGFRVNLSDPLRINRLHLTATYSPDDDLSNDERWHLDLGFERYNFRARATLNKADFYDLFGPTKRSRKGHSLHLGYSRNLVNDRPRRLDLDVDATYWGDLETLPDFQNVPAPFDELWGVEADLRYRNVRSSLGHVDDEKGVAWGLTGAVDRVDGDWIPRLHGHLDTGFPLPAGHSSLWLRTSGGAAFGDRADPFSNFFFGGFGNNWVDHREIKRYREYYSLPGLELNQVGGRTFARAMLEWNLPPVRFRALGTPGFYVSWARPALFVAGLATNLDASSDQRTEAVSLGGQVDFQFTLLSRLEMTLSLGWAVAEEDGEDSRDEFMASLKVL